MSNFSKFMTASAASYRRSEREAQRKNREAARKYKLQQKEQAVADAAQAVAEYNNYLIVIKSIHKDAAEPVNWNTVLQGQPPAEPFRKDAHERDAKNRLEKFKPSILDKLLGSGPKKVKKLERQLIEAKMKDDHHFEENLKKFENETAEHQFLQATAAAVLQKDTNGYKDAFEYFQPFADIAELGARLELQFRENNITIDLEVNSTEVIPDYVLTLTSTGKLSRKNMPVTKAQELYQDYVCSAVLRLGREALGLFPVSYVVVNANGTLFDSGTGHSAGKTLVSVVITPEKLAGLNFETLDPSDAMKNFHHNMKFGKSTGFAGVEKIDATSLIL